MDEQYGGNWTFLEEDKKIKEIYRLSHSGIAEEEIEKDWENFISKKCVVCGAKNPGLVNLFSPTKEFAAQYLFVSPEHHKVIFTRICRGCSNHPDFIEALKIKLIEIYKETN